MIASVKLKDLFSYESAEFEFEPGVTLIEGWNKDDGTPEGSGKSSIANTITWVCFGKIPKDATIDSVIREGAESGYGLVRLRNGAEIYRSRFPNDLYFRHTDGGPEVRGKDAKETQSCIQNLLGMGFETFCQAVYFPQNYAKKFITSSEAEKALIISEIQDLNDFTEARKAAAKLCTAQEAAFKTADSELQLARTQVEGLARALTESEGLLLQFKHDQAARLAQLDAAISRVKLELAELDCSANPEALVGMRETVQSECAAIEGAIAEIKKLLLAAESAEADRVRKEKDLKRAEFELSTHVEEHRELLSRRGKIDLNKLEAEQTDLAGGIDGLEVYRAELKGKLLNVRQISDSREKLAKRIKMASDGIVKIAWEIEDFQNSKEKLCPTCGAEMKKSHSKKHVEELEARKATLETERQELVAELESIQEESPKDLEAELTSTEANLKELKLILAGFDRERLEGRSLDRDVKATQTRIDSVRLVVAALKENLNKPVPEGEKPQVTVGSLRKDLEEACRALKQARENDAALQRELEEAREARRIEKSLKGDLTRLEKSRAEEAARSGASIETVIESSKARLVSAQDTVRQREETRAAAFNAIAKLETLKQGFGEVKSYVFRGLLQELTKKANKFISELFEVPVSIRFSNEGKDGEVSKIQVFVTIYGKERPLGLFSGGQERRIQIAVDLALSEIIAARSHKVMDIRFFDEPFKDLSELSMEKAVKLFESLKGSTILIEHNSIAKSVVNNVIRVELENKISRRVS